MSFKVITNKKLALKAPASISSAPSGATKATNESPNSSQKSLGELFSAIDVKYSSGLFTEPEVPSLERLELKEVSPEDILANAKTSLEEYRVNSLNNISTTNDTKLQKLKTDETDAVLAAENKSAELIGKYDGNVETIKQDALSKGVSRSSIVNNRLASNELNKNLAVDSVRQELQYKLDTVKQSVVLLEAQRESALTNFDIAYAAKLEEKILKLTEEVESANQAIIKYNNTITTQEETIRQKQSQEVLDQIATYAKIRDSNTANYFAELARSEKLQAAFDYLSGYSKAEAIAFATNNSNLKTVLGSNYSTLINWLNLRDS